MPARPYALVTHTLTDTSDETSFGQFKGHFNISLNGMSGDTVVLERTFDDEVTIGIVETYTADAEDVHFEPETGVKYRLRLTGGAGPVKVRISQ